MKKLQITSAVEIGGKMKKSSRTFANVDSEATLESFRECGKAINSLIEADEKSAFMIEITKL